MQSLVRFVIFEYALLHHLQNIHDSSNNAEKITIKMFTQRINIMQVPQIIYNIY